MQDQKLEWEDIAYFSKGLLSVKNEPLPTITISKSLTPEDFISELLAASTKAENTLNLAVEPSERSSSFPGFRETAPVYDETKKEYTKTVTYTFAHTVTLSKEEVEGK